MLFGKRVSSWDNFYLGCFSLLFGIWRITDTRFSPLIFANNAKAIGYITILALFILPIPLLLFIDELHAGKHRLLLRASAFVTGVVAFVALMLQIFGIAELRETLVLCHIMLIVDVAASVFAVMFHKAKNSRERNAQLSVVLLGAGCIIDLVYYYLLGTSSGMAATLVIFLICALYEFVVSLSEMSRKAYIDEKTKLYNRMRWDEIIENKISDNEIIGVMMIDINNLKQTNDTYGHSAGDKLIADFADILRRSVGSSGTLFRWGGDEFVVLVRKANRQKLEDCVARIHKEADEHNSLEDPPSIHFACGYAVSDDYPTLSKRELLDKADEFMYEDKKRWHEEYARATTS